MAKRARQTRRNERPPPPVSFEEWQECGSLLLSLAEPSNAPAEEVWREVRRGDRLAAVRAVSGSEAVARAIKAWLWWARLITSMQLSKEVTLSNDGEQELLEHLSSHVSYLIAPKPETIRLRVTAVEDNKTSLRVEERKAYGRSWFSETQTIEGLADMWRRAVRLPERRRATSPWAIPSPIAAADERTEARDRIMVDPPWLAGVGLDILSREYRHVTAPEGQEAVRCSTTTTDLFQRAFIQALDGFVRASLKTMAGGRTWFASEGLDDDLEFSPYFSFWGSRHWVVEAAHLSHPLAGCALPTAVLVDLRDYVKRLAKENNDHSSQAGRPLIHSADPDDLAALIEERSR